MSVASDGARPVANPGVQGQGKFGQDARVVGAPGGGTSSSPRINANYPPQKIGELRVVGANCAVSVEHGQGDARHLFKRVAIGLEARGGPHALNRHHEEVCQRFGVMRAREFAARVGATQCLDEDRLHAGLVVAQEVRDDGIARVSFWC
jgi:hypothetical protein